MAPIAITLNGRRPSDAANSEIRDISMNGESAATSSTPCPLSAPLILTFVGLPCSGKSLAAHRVARHLTWRGDASQVFTVEEAADESVLAQIKGWFTSDKNIAIIDGMHLTQESRIYISKFCKDNVFHHLIIEMSCSDEDREMNIVDTMNFYQKTNRTFDSAIEEKLIYCKEKYEPCSPIEAPLITVNSSANPIFHAVTARGVCGAIQSCILGVLAHPLIKEQVFYFTRHGESEYNILGRIGGDADLSPRGMKYAERLARALGGPGSAPDSSSPKLIWTSELQRTIHTAKNIPGNRTCLKELNEIDAGICESLTYEEIQERFPQEFAWRDQDKLKYRYPHGESYLDLLQRVDSVVQGLLTMSEVLVVSHQAVLRCVMAYFKGSKQEDIPYINVPLHTLLVVRSLGYDFEVETVPLKVECVDTYRVQPVNCNADRTNADALQTVPPHFDAPIS